jgi:2-polyprenyl-6-methoxyphenol hydroxylase-like FAD-dependent oxidoreductase
MNTRVEHLGDTAVVIGASMAGLLAARAVAPHFARTVVLERDELLAEPVVRKGTPQAAHAHGLLARGGVLLEELFPGFTSEMRARGAHYVDWFQNTLMMRSYGWGAQVPTDMRLLMSSRPLLETVLRERVAALPGVEIRDRSQVIGLLASADGAGVAGACTTAGEVRADLVVDASGRGSGAPSWLRELGYPAPEEVVIDAKWGYATRFYTAPAGFDPDHVLWVSGPNPISPDVARRTRGFAALHVEGDRRWLLTLSGCAGDHPPADEDGFLAFVSAVPDYAQVVDWVKNATPLTPIRTSKSTTNRLRRFETLERRPERFVVIGDAVAAFNPVYGQGMTLAAMAAVDLGAELDRCGASGGALDGLAGAFQERLAGTSTMAWMISTGADYGVEGVDGPPQTPEAAQMAQYMARIEALTAEDDELLVKFLATVQLTMEPDWLFDPELTARVQQNWDRLGPTAPAGQNGQS